MKLFGVDFFQLALGSLLPVVLIAIGFAPVCVAVFLVRRKLSFRRSPLPRDLLRPPGYSLQAEIDRLRQILDEHLFFALLLPFMTTFPLVFVAFGGKLVWFPIVIVIFFIVANIFIFRKIYKTSTDIWYKRRGLDGEIAVAEELNLLMLDGCRVFHDVPIERGNIDHVVISRSGVYAVETKTLGRLGEISSAVRIVVDHTKNEIRFPDRTYPIPIRQLETQVRLLGAFLSSSVGKPIAVESVLAIPGWYIEDRIGKGTVYVINPRNPQKFFIQNRVVLDEHTILQVAHQLDRVCRDVKIHSPIRQSWN